MKKLALLLALICALPAVAAEHTLYQSPTLSSTHIAFAYAGDIWTVPRGGGEAKRLTTHAGIERDPRFSPDGTLIAFSGEYDGNVDVFVVSAAGGEPKRITFHPGPDRVAGWTSDGKRILFRSTRQAGRGYDQLFTVALDGTLPELVPLPHAVEGSFSPDGSRLAYQPISQWQPDWKRHKGGQAGQIWIARLSDSAVERVPHEGSNDHAPAWMGDAVYFISDRGSRTGTKSIFVYDTRSRAVAEVVPNEGLDIKSLSAGPDALVYERFGTIFLFDPKTKSSKQLAISVGGDFLGVRPRYEAAAESIRNARISASGARAVFETRGEIVTVPAEKGDARNLTRTPGVMERDPAWSPDGKWIAYFSDESGEYSLVLRDQRGENAKKIDLGEPATFYYSPVWSPDSTKIAYTDRRLNLWYVDVASGKKTKVDTNPIGMTGSVLEPAWSPDSKWIAYARYMPNLMRAVFVHSLATSTSTRVTDGLSDVVFPVFDRSGKYLFFAASTDIGLGLSFADLSGIDSVATRNVYAAVLRNDLPSPLAPESDEEKANGGGKGDDPKKSDDAKKDEKKDAKKDDKKDGEKPKVDPVRIDLDGIGQRIIALPVPNGDVQGLAAGKAGVLFVFVAKPSHFGAGGEDEGFDVKRFDFEKRKTKDFLSGVNAIDFSADGSKVLFRKKRDWTIASTDGEPKPGEGNLSLGALQVRVDPRAEWRQMFRDAWLGERDHFYAPNHHGLDLAAAKKLYEPFLDAVAHREDLNYLFREMLNQLTIGHMFVSGGSLLETKSVPGGLLGADYAVENGRYRFARVYSGENWNPDLQAPLTQPGVNVKAGEYLISVAGQNLTAADNIYAAFENTAGKQVAIKVGSKPDGSDAREVIVVPVRSESGLRTRAWIEDNRRKVEKLSNGRLAYIYIPNTGGQGYTSFNRDFFTQTEKEGAVVDERFNQGGLLADYVANMVTRPQLGAIAFRYAEKDVAVPAGAIYGPKAMLINSMAGSGGDAMPWFFRKMNAGPLIGTRTWGGLVASRPGPTLMDGGRYTAPDAAVYGLDGKWEVENAGVAPDIEVELDPAAWRQGRDTQLERAVDYLLGELAKKPRTVPVRPEFPVYERCCGLDTKK